ncbi:M24 family metallopeptidase [Amycolatopsis keratiniphila]|uniref:Peptidase M24 family protein n=1 Tax=Amycolatopsis keratiniphila subsp. keratiniphila TaxID=227715 RepID=A0A1W2LV30_9PSEU|nr:Xaa-Pro peptidase family protein [Amycolatopsis keratiniphila]OLZ61480.1 peptidase M24 family protein [Amycolatopsis keratiniphila subsp. nogabecina]ONF68908.1 peptidase M24 family protein [Amycolatopsis keratiniphila subsp. keratiniphila]SDU19653.1 Xaa-Pro aminopeptidase [Amycolatopsis keratiniphila]
MSRRSLHNPAPDAASLRARLDRARAAAAAADTDALLIAPGSDLRYLIGQAGGSFERLTTLVIPADGVPALVLPKLEAPGYADVPAEELGIEIVTWVDGDNAYELVADRLGKPGRVAVSDFTPALHVLAFRGALGDADQTLAGPIVRELRMRKDAAEIQALRDAGAAIDRVHARVHEWLRPGRTEAEVGADITAAIVEEGHTHADFVIVGSGPNGASPHHDVSERVIERGDVVVVDIGGPIAEGYNSDSTRTYAVGEPRDADVAETYAVLQRAQKAAVDAVRPGVTAESIDAAARDIIAEAGYGEYFIHRTGHGIGLDVHEEPYIIKGNALPLEPGMAFSVEPGIYQPGRWGARIEDIVVVTEDGVESVNQRPHDLIVLDA